MPRLFLKTVCLLVLFALVVACQPAATPLPPTVTPAPQATSTPNNSVRLSSGEWPPYTSENLPHFGLASRIVTEAFALKGITVEYGTFRGRALLNSPRMASGTVRWSGTKARNVKQIFISVSLW